MRRRIEARPTTSRRKSRAINLGATVWLAQQWAADIHSSIKRTQRHCRAAHSHSTRPKQCHSVASDRMAVRKEQFDTSVDVAEAN